MQLVTLVGVDDDNEDGDIAFEVTFSWNGVVMRTVAMTSVDDDTAGLATAVVPVANATVTDELETLTVAVAVSLTSAPFSSVRVEAATSDTGEGVVSPALLSFSPSNWASPQVVTVRGVRDNVNWDGDQVRACGCV